MHKKNFKIYASSNKMLNFTTSEEVLHYLNENFGGNKEKLKFVEVYDPVTGWDFANTWLQLQKNKEFNLESDFAY